MSGHPERCAIILCAGYSGRMHRFKPLMQLDGQGVLERVVGLHRDAGVTDIRVVTGFRAEEIRSSLTTWPVSVIYNPAFDTGMFSSVLAGINALPADVESFFIHPVDIPLVRSHSLTRLMAAFDENPAPVIYPVFDGQRGHPPLIHGELVAAILAHDGSGGLRAVLDRFDAKALEIPVADEGILLDLDTPEDFQRMAQRQITAATALTENECRVLMEKVQRLPAPLIDHCRLVACVAQAIALAVNAGGGAVEVSLIRSAALVHDVARGVENHAAAGADLLKAMGFPAMAAIVAAHMHIAVADDTPLDEAQIVHLADKLADGHTLVSLAQRFQAKRRKFGHDPQAAAAIERRRQTAMTIRDKLERIAGESVDRILEKAGIVSGSRSCATG